MPPRDDPWPPGTPNWTDISVPDLGVGTAFYRDVLGWTMVDSGPDFGNYHIAQVSGRAVAGVGPVMEEGQPTAWTLYFASDDADATAKLVSEHGGQVMMGPMDIPGNGRMAIAADPTGAVFGVWQADGMIGAGIVNEPGAMVWEDGRLADPEAARRFYGSVFGYTFGPVPGAPEDYTTFDLDGRPAGGLGGMMGAPEGTPSHWVVYFGVTDTDATVSAASERGGSVLGPAMDTPFGRMAFLADPFGAPFAVIQSSGV